MKSEALFSRPFKIVLNLNLNGLLVIRQIDNTSPGGCARREISPWFSQEMRTWTHSHFSRGDQRNREVIPVPDSLWKEATFVRLFATLSNVDAGETAPTPVTTVLSLQNLMDVNKFLVLFNVI